MPSAEAQRDGVLGASPLETQASPGGVPGARFDPPANDMSAGTLTHEGRRLANLGLEEHSHRLNLQRTVASSALAFAALFFMAAIVFGGVLAYKLAGDDGAKIHWHASILVAAFVVPPTVILIALLRAVYDAGAPKDTDGDAAPALAFIKEVLSSVAVIFKK